MFPGRTGLEAIVAVECGVSAVDGFEVGDAKLEGRGCRAWHLWFGRVGQSEGAGLFGAVDGFVFLLVLYCVRM